MPQSKLTPEDLFQIYKAGEKTIDRFAENLWDNQFNNSQSDLYLGQSYQNGLNRAAVGLKSLGFYFDPQHNPEPLVQRYLRERGGNFITWLSNTGKKDFANVLIDAYTNTGSYDEFKKLFREKYPMWQDWKSLQIWRTENNVAVNKASFDIYDAYRVTGFKVIGGGAPCAFCAWEQSFDHYLNDMRPPYHVYAHVFDDLSYILLKNRGWTLVKDVEIGDIALSLNPETKEIEEVEVVDTFVNLFDGDLVHLHNNNADILVTSDHKIVYQSDWDSKHNKDKPYRFKEIKDFGTWDRLPRTGTWKGKYIEKVNIGSLEIDIVTFLKFAGYYLSEGSLNGNGCFISQTPGNKKDQMLEDLKGLPLKISSNKDGIYISTNEDLSNYLRQFGKSNEKYVPDIIKELTPDLINIFLDAYLLGDRTIQKEKTSIVRGLPLKANSTRKWYSTSKKMIEDISELIIKVGNRPAFYTVSKKGKMTGFKNKKNYPQNFDVLLVSERTSKYTTGQKIKKDFIPYKGKAVGITLERNHTVFVKRNNKVSIVGNCICVTQPIFAIDERANATKYDRINDYMTDKEYARMYKNYEKFNVPAQNLPQVKYTEKDMRKAIDEILERQK